MGKQKLFFGIDVSKGYADFCLLTSSKVPLDSNFQLDDNKYGHQILIDKLQHFIKQGYDVVCGLENTGGYERNWLLVIKSLVIKLKSIEVYKLNPKAVKYQIQSLMRRTIDDGVSAEGIAIYMINNYELVKQNWTNSTNQKQSTTEGQLLHSMIQGLIKQKTMKMNQLEKLLYQTFPEVLKFMKNSTPMWVYKLIKKYPSARAVRQAQVESLVKIKGISLTKATELKSLSSQSVASLQGRIAEIIVSQHSMDIMNLEEEIDKLKGLLVEIYKDDPTIALLTTVKGIGEWTAIAFAIELGDYSRFENTDQLAAFYGVNPSFKQSGDGKFKVKMSKQGNPRMRAILYLIAHNVFMHNEYFKALYAKYRAKGKKHSAVMGILMHKILRIMWGMLKTQKPFDHKVDEQNQIKSISDIEPSNTISNKSRRYQDISLEAPISRSNSKKRKAIIEPQSLINNEHTRSSEYSPLQT